MFSSLIRAFGRFGRKEGLNGSGFFFWPRTIPPLDPANPACPAGWPRDRKVKGGKFSYFSESLAYSVGRRTLHVFRVKAKVC